MDIEQALEVITDINDYAHNRAWSSWSLADVEEDDERAEELREEASLEQASYFREEYNRLPKHKRVTIWNYAITDEDFRDQFSSWYGWLEFQERFQFEQSIQSGVERQESV